MSETIVGVLARVRASYARLGTWRLVGRELGVSAGMAWKLAHEEGYEPRKAEVRKRLGLAVMGMAPLCDACGVVHVGKCGRLREAADLWGTPVKVLRWRLENREEMQ